MTFLCGRTQQKSWWKNRKWKMKNIGNSLTGVKLCIPDQPKSSRSIQRQILILGQDLDVAVIAVGN